VILRSPVFLLADVEKKAAVARNDETGSKGAPHFTSSLVEDTLDSVAGFQISQSLGVGVVPTDETKPGSWTIWSNKTKILGVFDCWPWIISDTANLGSMIRCASAFGCRLFYSLRTAAMLVPTKCEGEYGACLSSPCVRVEDLAYNAKAITRALFVTSYAAVIDTDADPNSN
jgi:hypothetical protein